MLSAVRLSVVAVVMLFSVHSFAQGNAPGDAQSLLQRFEQLNGRCRGGSGNDPATWAACDERERLGPRLNALGWCFGREGEMGAEMQWHRCGPNSRRWDSQN